MTADYEGLRRVVYGGATFIPVCPACGRFVKTDRTVRFRGLDGGWIEEPNADCARCGRATMPFEGFFEE